MSSAGGSPLSRGSPPSSFSPPPGARAYATPPTVSRVVCRLTSSLNTPRQSIVGFDVSAPAPAPTPAPPPSPPPIGETRNPALSGGEGTPSLMRRRSSRWLAHDVLGPCVSLARRLDLPHAVVSSLEDHAFELLAPRTKARLEEGVADAFDASDAAWAVREIKRALREDQVRYVDVYGRRKGSLSMWRKARSGRDVNDLLALRIIVSDAAPHGGVDECRRALQATSRAFAGLGEALQTKDYISSPKRNGYQSLHRTFLLDAPPPRGPDQGPRVCRLPLEVQVRTESMHETSNRGSAAHWRYKQQEVCA